MADRDHLFISYAWEDQAFARWLALRLTAEGYRVWFDQIKLLGGESWPRDIDTAIKNRTFRMLGLLSHHSIAKPNPLKERTLALNIAKTPGRAGFLIPLNVDGLSATDLDWLSSDITFIPFQSSWARGLFQLLKLLEREACPKFDGNGRAIVSEIASASEIVVPQSEVITSNVCRFPNVPTQLVTYLVSPSLASANYIDALRNWAFYSISPHRVVAFEPPDDDLATWLQADPVRTVAWRSTPEIEGVTTDNIIVALLRRSIECHCKLRGLRWSDGAKAYAFQGTLGKKLPVRLPSGATTSVQLSGKQTFFRIGQPKVPYHYRVAATVSIERDLLNEFSVVWRLRFHFTDINDQPLPVAQHLSRQKHVTRSWFNRHWLVRHLAVIQYLAGDDGMIRVGRVGPQQVVLDCSPLSFDAPKSIDELKLEELKEIGDEVPVEDDDSELEDSGELIDEQSGNTA